MQGIGDLLLKKEWFVESKKNAIKDDYQFMQELGSGAFGKVMLGKHKLTGELRAVKIIHKLRVKDVESFKNEVQILSKLDHPNVIKMLETYESDRICFLVTEYCEGGELFFHITKTKRLTEEQAANAMRQMIQAVRYIHDQGICHRDIKPENFLLKFADDDNSIKLIDFGLAKKVDPNQLMSSVNGTPFYIAPEVLQGAYSYACDNWSLGVVLYVMLSGCPPYGGKNNEEILHNVQTATLQFTHPVFQMVSSSAKDLIQKMLQRDPSLRMSSEEAYNHPWIQRKVAEKMREIQIPLDALDNLHSFITSQQLKRATLTYIASKVPEEEIEPLRDAFLKLDINGDGTITREELESGLLSIGKFIDNKIMNQLVQVLDSNKNGILDYTEFIAACMNSQNYVDEVRIKECFVNMDKDKSGKLSVEELKQFFQAGDIISDIQQIENIIAEVDIDKDGQISYGEFLMMMRKT